MTDLTIDGDTFRVRVEGDESRPHVMLSNSLGTDLTLWDAQMPALLDHFRVVRYDSRGHGGSVAEAGPYSIARLGSDALAIMDTLKIETTHFIGISMGGAVGQWLLAYAPERIERAVLANTVAHFGAPDLWNTRIRTALSDGMEPLAATTMERWFGVEFRSLSPARVAAIKKVFRVTSPIGYAACCAALRDMDLREKLLRIERPVLVVTGRDDPVTTGEGIALLTRRIRDAKHVALDCRHLSNVEAAAGFNTAVIDFLTEKARTRAPRTRASREPASTRKRHPTTGRATAARNPLKKGLVDRVPKKAKAGPSKKADRATAARRRPTVNTKTARSRTEAAKRATPKKPLTVSKPKKTSANMPGRRKTTTTAARGPVKKPATRIKTTKSATKKIAPKKAPTKKVPIARRKATTKPLRPTGRRKP